MVEERSCGNPECVVVFEWSSWGQDKRYHDFTCKKRHEQLIKIAERQAERQQKVAARNLMTEKQCVGTPKRPGCARTIPIDRFQTRTESSVCKDCTARYMAEYDSQRAEARASLRKESLVEITAGVYNMTPDQLTSLIERANGCCEVCGQEVPLNVDHARETGIVRGMLCGKHNLGLGLFDHDPELLQAAITYLTNESLHVKPMGVKGRPCERCGVKPKLPGHGMRRCADCYTLCLYCDRNSEDGRATCTRHRSSRATVTT